MSLIFYGNTAYNWLIAVAVVITATLVITYVKRAFIRKLSSIASRTATCLDDILVGILSSTQPLFTFIICTYFSSNFLTLPGRINNQLSHIAFIALLIQIGLWADKAATLGLAEYQRKQREVDPSSLSSTGTLGFIVRMVLWIVITLFIFENLGFNITTLVASLGIGGIAIALAVQNILGDLFASLSIVLDKPFVIGDFIIINDAMGTVEYIGLKTTRLRSLSGEQIIFSNANILKERINNYKRMFERRVVFNLHIVYATKKEQLSALPAAIKEIILKQPNTRFDRAHFKEYTPYSLNFEVVYYVISPDFNTYMDIHQAINLELFEKFEQENIQFAHPVHTVHLMNGVNQQDGNDVPQAASQAVPPSQPSVQSQLQSFRA